MTTKARITISNRVARQLWLNKQQLATVPTGRLDLAATIQDLGYVQLDTIRTVARAQDHILWSRNQNYREGMLDKLLADDRAVFEHFSHDACVLPMSSYPMWRRQFRRKRDDIRRLVPASRLPGPVERRAIKARIKAEGPLCSEDFKSARKRSRESWTRPAHKIALDYLWYAGELATSHRIKFKKYYDLTERVIPDSIRAIRADTRSQIDWVCSESLSRLGFATAGEMQRFFCACSLDEVKRWLRTNPERVVTVNVEAADGSRFEAVAPATIEAEIATLARPTSRLRLLNPFDPVVRDRRRLARLFAFDFRIEIYVPKSKRKYGYYVYPILEGDRFVGRIEARADRLNGTLSVVDLWPEAGVRWSANRRAKLESELRRIARFVGVTPSDADKA